MLLKKVKLIIRLFFAEDFGQVHESFVPQVRVYPLIFYDICNQCRLFSDGDTGKKSVL